MAYSGQYNHVYNIFKSLKPEDRFNYCNKYILNQCIWGGIQKLRKLQDQQWEIYELQEKSFVEEVLNLFIEYCEIKRTFPRELYQSILHWVEMLISLSYLDSALNYLQSAIDLGIAKHADLQLSAKLKVIQIYDQKGNLEHAYSLMYELAKRPYFVTDWNQVPEIIFALSQLALKKGDSKYYKKLLFLGLRLFYTNTDVREKFVSQLRNTYRRSIYLLQSFEVDLLNKFFYSIHWVVGKIPDLRKIHLGIINRQSKFILLAYIYFHNFITRKQPIISKDEIINHSLAPNTRISKSNVNLYSMEEPKKRILITRAMGGIGDFIMMTPGFHALKKKYPNKEIHLAIPKQYFPVFENNNDVKLIDIENESLSHLSYNKWFNFSSCPAARVESRTAPKVKKSRIEIFSQALGISFLQRMKMDKTPRFFLRNDEIEFAKSFVRNNKLEHKAIIGVQLHSDESYRDYPFMEKIVEIISEHNPVLLFDSEPIEKFNFNNVVKIQSLPLRKAFAIASRCSLIIAPDSSFVHFAAALRMPTIALYGPIDGKIRTKDYPNCVYLDIKDKFGCSPCWRNENIPCKLTGLRASVCMENIPVQQVVNEVNKILSESSQWKS